MKKDWLFRIGALYLIFLVIFAIFGPTIRYSYEEMVAKPHLPPSGQFWLGTDEQGRDIFARLAYGARISLFIGFLVQGITVIIGTTMGILGAFAPKWIREPLMRLTDGMFAFPDILLAILVIGIFGSGLWPVVLALTINSWPSITRLIRNQAASLKDREFVVASKALGAPAFYIVRKHVLPQLTGILLAVSIVDLAGIILAESALSFLGIGVQAPDPSWGNMINTARLEMNSYPLQLVWPCTVLSLTIFALNFVGEGLRAILDPRNKTEYDPVLMLNESTHTPEALTAH